MAKKSGKQVDCENVLGEAGLEICEVLEEASMKPVTRVRQSPDQGFPLVIRSLNPRTEPTGLKGATPGLAAIVRANTIPATPAWRDPPQRPKPRRDPPGCSRADPPRRERPRPYTGDGMTAAEQDALAKRGLSTSRALPSEEYPQGLITRSAPTNQRSRTMKPKIKVLKAGPRDIVARQIRINPADEPRWVETIGSIVFRTTIGALPRPQLVRRSKARAQQPAAVVYQRGVDSNGRPKLYQALSNMVRRSVGLPR